MTSTLVKPLSEASNSLKEKTMEDKELKKRLKKVPDVDKNGNPIYKIDGVGKSSTNKTGKTLNTPKK